MLGDILFEAHADLSDGLRHYGGAPYKYPYDLKIKVRVLMDEMKKLQREIEKHSAEMEYICEQK